MKENTFLTAEWRKLVMVNYEVDPLIMSAYLPAKTELDYWNENCYVSLVGFLFKNVKVRGVKIPFHVNFPEVNLRFYVRYKENEKWKRGVVFIREIVPKPAITFIANTLFHEHYLTLPMKYSWEIKSESQLISYQWKKNNLWNKIEVMSGTVSSALVPDSMEEFITEHFWGYSSINKNKTGEYHVDHPRWDIYKIENYSVDCDFAGVYGKSFSLLQSQTPDSVFMAEGSPVSVFKKKIL
jgi:uncharacterized protein